MSGKDKKRTTTCTECKGEAYWVDRGKDIGQYYWCPTCKKEDKEWKNKNDYGYPFPMSSHFSVGESESKYRPDSDFDLFAYPAPWISGNMDEDYTGV
jgi:hypothetical protein